MDSKKKYNWKDVTKRLIVTSVPKWMQEQLKLQEKLSTEIHKCEKKLGKEKTAQIVERVKNEAYAQPYVNSEYVIKKLKEAAI